MFQIAQQFVVDAALVAKANRGLALHSQDVARYFDQVLVVAGMDVADVSLQSCQPVLVVMFEVIVNLVRSSPDNSEPPRE